jgi:hypothetical protein
LWVVEVTLMAIVVLLLILPIQDYALREFKEWLSHPSPETLAAFRTKQQEELHVRLTTAVPFITLAGLVAFTLYRRRPKSMN